MKANLSAMTLQLNRAKRIESNYLLVIPPHGPASVKQLLIGFRWLWMDVNVTRTSAECLDNVAESL